VHSWKERLAVFAFAVAVIMAIVAVAFATGYIIGKLIL
jgi:nitrate reductase NapE component